MKKLNKTATVLIAIGCLTATILLILFLPRNVEISSKESMPKNAASASVVLLPETDVNDDNTIENNLSSLKLSYINPLNGVQQNKTFGLAKTLQSEATTLQDKQTNLANELFEFYNKLTDVNGDCIYTGDGHTIYAGKLTKTYGASQAGDMVNFIFNGAIPMIINNDYTKPLIATVYQNLYTEDTGKRLYVFDEKSDLDIAQTGWEIGQKILHNQTTAAQGTTILDGRYTPGVQFEIKDNRMYVPLKTLLPYLYNGSGVNETAHVACVMTNGYLNNQIGLTIPTDYADVALSSVMNVKNGKFDASFTIGNNTIKQTVPTATIDGYKIDVSELETLFGWKCYTNGNVLLILTDNSNYSNIFITTPEQSNTTTPIEYEPTDEELQSIINETNNVESIADNSDSTILDSDLSHD